MPFWFLRVDCVCVEELAMGIRTRIRFMRLCALLARQRADRKTALDMVFWMGVVRYGICYRLCFCFVWTAAYVRCRRSTTGGTR